MAPGLALALALAAPVCQAEPPDNPGLHCEVTQQQVGQGTSEGMGLQVRFSNRSDEPLTLPAGPHLVWYRDAAAEEPLERTVRAGRLQNVPLTVQAGAAQTVLFAFTPTQLDELRCQGTAPAAAGLYFYRFSRWPTFRCLLQGYALDALQTQPAAACPSRP